MHSITALRTYFTKLKTSVLLKHFLLYAGGACMLRGASMLVTPLTLKLLSPQEYGIVALLHSFTSITTVLLGFGLRQALSLEFFHNNDHAQRTMINHIITIYTVLAVPLCILALYNGAYVSQTLFLNKVPVSLIAIAVAYCFLFFFVEFLYQLLSYQGHARLLTYLQTGTALCIIMLNVLFLMHYKLGIYSSMTSYLIGYVLVFGISFYAYLQSSCLATYDFYASIRALPHYVRIGLPFVPSMLCNWIVSSSDRWLLARMSSLHDVGIYTLADAFGQLYLMIILQPLGTAYFPYLMKEFSANKNNLIAIEQANRKRTLYGMLGMLCAMTLGYIMVKPILRMLMPAKYHDALRYVMVLLTSYILLTGTYCFSALIQFHKRTWFLASALCIPALCNCILNILLIPRWGIAGCVWATCIAQFCYCSITYWYGNRILKTLATQSDETRVTPAHTHVETLDHVLAKTAQTSQESTTNTK